MKMEYNMNKTKMSTTTAFVAIIGKPNVGKSSLLNKLIGEKVAIVSSKPQTTRTQIRGVLTEGDLQIVFIDTPGIHSPKNKLGQYMMGQVKESFADVDCAVLVVDATHKISDTEKGLIENLTKRELPTILALNKIDLIPDKSKLMEVITTYTALMNFAAIVPISALNGSGTAGLMEEVGKFAVSSPHFFPEDSLTDQPERIIMSEIIREKILRSLHDEIPHGTAVVIDKMKERENSPIMDIDATILCERDSHKGMIIGKQGVMLKRIGTHARQDMEAFLGIKVNLKCWVKVKEDWRNRAGIIRTFGYE